MNKQLTNREFNSATTELVKVARELLTKGYRTSISFFDTFTIMYIHTDEVCYQLCISKERYVSLTYDFENFFKLADKENIKLGKYLSRIQNALNNKDDNSDYCRF